MDSKLVIVIFCIFTFLAGLYFYVTIDEPFETKKQDVSCPDVLIRKGGSLLLYNSKDPNAEVLPFYNIDEYINYLEIQRRAGKHCPVLFLQYESTAAAQYRPYIVPTEFRPIADSFDRRQTCRSPRCKQRQRLQSKYVCWV